MNKQTTWNKTLAAQNYDFGRPLDEKIIVDLFNKIKENITDFSENTLLDAGCGTGRITIPVAKHFPNLQITGVDTSLEMLEVFQHKISKLQIKNYQIIHGDLLKLNLPDNSFKTTLISSVLHGIEDWKLALNKLIRVTKPSGYLLLVSEQDDVTNIGLGRAKSSNDNLLKTFWRKYVEFHFKNGLGRLDKPQVGIKWQLGHPEVIQYLEEKKFIAEKKEISLNWKKEFTVSDFMKIIEGRPWSIMFTADDQKYNTLITDIKNWLKEQNISPLATCISNNTLMCEIVKITK